MMPVFLSEEWFATVAAQTPAGDRQPVAVLEQVVDGTPGGRVTYRVEVSESDARIVWPVAADAARADLRMACDWPTAVGVARGEISTQRAIMEGRLRVSGNPGRLAELAGVLDGVDPVPPAVRRNTAWAAAS